MKSDKQFLDEIHEKIEMRQKQRVVAGRKAVKLKYMIVSLSSALLIIILVVTTWQIISNDIRFKVTRPENAIESVIKTGGVPYINKNELIYRSDLIIRGTVKNVIGSRWTNPDRVLGNHIANSIDTYLTVDISEIYKGIPVDSKTIVISTPGGQIGNTQIIFRASPELKIGDRVILFLMKKTTGMSLNFYPYKDSYEALGLNYGIYFYNSETDKYITEPKDADSIIDLTTFADEIESELN